MPNDNMEFRGKIITPWQTMRLAQMAPYLASVFEREQIASMKSDGQRRQYTGLYLKPSCFLHVYWFIVDYDDDTIISTTIPHRNFLTLSHYR